MTHGARTTEEIYTSLRDNLKGKIATLTNFTPNSFNDVWTNAVAEELREKEIQLTVAQFSGWVDYAGGPITEDDLQDLEIDDDVTVEEVSEFVDSLHLDELVRIVGVTRDTGVKASGTVTFTTQSAATTIAEGTEVGTQPDSTGEFNSYVTTEQVSTGSGVTEVEASIEADEVGQDFNTGSGTITFLPNPPGGVQAVTNDAAVSGGEDRESNEELRERAKQAVFRQSGGGTVEGMVGFIEENTGASEVEIIEFPSGDAIRNYPHGHVVAVGGTDAEVLAAIDDSRPASVEHVLRRPATITLSITATLDGEAIDTDRVEEDITEFLQDLGLSDDMIEDKLIFTIIGSDEDINNIVTLVYTVENEPFFFDSSQDVYEVTLDDEMSDDGITDVTGTLLGSSHTFVEDTDYQEWNTGAGNTTTPHDAIDWSVGRTSTGPTSFSYSAGTDEYFIDADMVHDGITNVDNTTQATTLTKGVDYEEADTDADDLQDGIRFLNAQTDGDNIEVTYDAGDLPDVKVNQTDTQTFNQETLRYPIDDAMIDDGITEVDGTLNGSPHTFVEDTDFEEWDSNGDGRADGIDWSIGGDNPDDDTSFTVTYEAGTQFLVDYDIDEQDITIDQDEIINAGTIVVTVV